MATVTLLADRELALILARERLAPLTGLSPVHPQTVRYRIARLS